MDVPWVFYSFTNLFSLQKANYCDLIRQSSTLQRIKKRVLCLMCSEGGRGANVSDLNQYSPNKHTPLTHYHQILVQSHHNLVTARTSIYTRKPQMRCKTHSSKHRTRSVPSSIKWSTKTCQHPMEKVQYICTALQHSSYYSQCKTVIKVQVSSYNTGAS